MSDLQTLTRPPSVVHQRILDAAVGRFYREGIRAVSADRIIADAGVSKVTFYRHFATKDDLVVAYLDHMAGLEEAAYDSVVAAHPGDALGALHAWARAVGAFTCSDGFRGCAFLNAAAEFADAGHPARAAVERYRIRQRLELARLLRAAGSATPESSAEHLQMLRDGAVLAGGLDGHPDQAAARFVGAVDSILAGLG